MMLFLKYSYYLSVPLQIVSSVVDIINGLQEWPDDVIQANDTGAQYVQSIMTVSHGMNCMSKTQDSAIL